MTTNNVPTKHRKYLWAFKTTQGMWFITHRFYETEEELRDSIRLTNFLTDNALDLPVEIIRPHNAPYIEVEEL